MAREARSVVKGNLARSANTISLKRINLYHTLRKNDEQTSTRK